MGIGYVPEGRGIFPDLSVRENLLMAARAGPGARHDWTYERVLATFPRLGERIGHGGTQLSGGEQQMLSIGRALMTHPDLLHFNPCAEFLHHVFHKRPEIHPPVGSKIDNNLTAVEQALNENQAHG